MLTLEDLRFFAVVADAPSLAEAARRLDVTPPAVSQRLAALERRLGVRLGERSRRGLALTEEGELIAARARVMIGELEELESQLTARRSAFTGKLRIAAPLGFGRRWVAPLAAGFQIEHPSLDIELVLSDRPPVNEGGFDLAVHIGELADSAGLVTKLAANDRVICAAPSYLAMHGAPADAAELRAHDCIALRENEEDATLWRFTRTGQPLSVRIRPHLATNDGEVARDWALAGRGIVVRSEWHVAADIEAGRLVRILPDLKPPPAPVMALLGHTRARLARTQGFLAHLRAGLNPAPWRAS
jgi:DNA-binding transcriptional LysR family regulator